MNNTFGDMPPAIHEEAFLQLLDSPGTVYVRIGQVGQYFVPLVYFTPPNTAERELRGVIVRNHGMFAAKSPGDLLDVLLDIAGETGTRCITHEDLPMIS